MKKSNRPSKHLYAVTLVAALSLVPIAALSEATSLFSALDVWHDGSILDLNNDGYCDFVDLFELSQTWAAEDLTPTPTPFPATGLRVFACQTTVAPSDELVVRVDLINPFGQIVNPGTEGGSVERNVQLNVSGSAYFLGTPADQSLSVRVFRPDGGAAYIVDFKAEDVEVWATATGLAPSSRLLIEFDPNLKPEWPLVEEETSESYDISAVAPVSYSRVASPPVFRWSTEPGSPPMNYTVTIKDRCNAVVWESASTSAFQKTYDGDPLSTGTFYAWEVSGVAIGGTDTASLPLVEKSRAHFLADR